LNKKCKKKPLEGNYIENTPIDPSKLIVVSAEAEVTEEILKKYFQNRAQSGGGDVQRVTQRRDGCFTIKFKHEEGKKWEGVEGMEQGIMQRNGGCFTVKFKHEEGE
jgi:hypothetical protein